MDLFLQWLMSHPEMLAVAMLVEMRFQMGLVKKEGLKARRRISVLERFRRYQLRRNHSRETERPARPAKA